MSLTEAVLIVFNFPWHVKMLLLAPLVTLCLVAILALRPRLSDPDDHYHYTFTTRLDKDLRKAFWKYSGEQVRTARENILQDAWRRLESETGPVSNFINMRPHHRAAWTHLWVRIRDMLR